MTTLRHKPDRPYLFQGDNKRALMVQATAAARNIRAANRDHEDVLADLIRRLAVAGQDDSDLAGLRLGVGALYDLVQQVSSQCNKLAEAIYARCVDGPPAAPINGNPAKPRQTSGATAATMPTPSTKPSPPPHTRATPPIPATPPAKLKNGATRDPGTPNGPTRSK